MRRMIQLGALAIVGSALAGCSQITVTSDAIIDGSSQMADVTTNAVAATSDVTTDTANDVDARSHAARRKFVQSQMAMLQREAARGRGEHLDTLAYMMHVEDTARFEQQLQGNYAQLFSNDADADQWLARLYRVVGTPPDMAASSRG